MAQMQYMPQIPDFCHFRDTNAIFGQKCHIFATHIDNKGDIFSTNTTLLPQLSAQMPCLSHTNRYLQQIPHFCPTFWHKCHSFATLIPCWHKCWILKQIPHVYHTLPIMPHFGTLGINAASPHFAAMPNFCQTYWQNYDILPLIPYTYHILPHLWAWVPYFATNATFSPLK